MSQKKWIYAFDLDDTLLRFNCSFGFYRFQLQRGRVSLRSFFKCLRSYLSYKFFEGGIHQIYVNFFNTFLKGIHYSKLEVWVEQYFASLAKNIFYQPCLNYLAQATSKNFPVVILSSSPRFLVKKFAAALNIPHFFASEYRFNSEGIYVAADFILDGEKKAVYLAECMKNLKIDRVMCFSNSIYDLPFLNFGTEVIVVNPDRKLKKLSFLNGWSVI